MCCACCLAVGRFYRWRVFYIACSELFKYNQGEEWGVAHYLFSKKFWFVGHLKLGRAPRLFCQHYEKSSSLESRSSYCTLSIQASEAIMFCRDRLEQDVFDALSLSSNEVHALECSWVSIHATGSVPTSVKIWWVLIDVDNKSGAVAAEWFH